MAADEVRIFPKDGKWHWERREGNKVVDSGSAKDRSKAVADGRKAAGIEETALFTEDGERYGVARSQGHCRVAFFREDGSEYGELDGAPSSEGGTPQIVQIAPAGENSEANGLGGE